MPDFDLKLLDAKRQLADAVMLPQRIRPLGPVPNQQPSPVHAQVAPMTYQIPAGAPGPLANQQQPMATRMAGMQANVQAPIGQGMGNFNVNMSPTGGFQGAGANVSMPMGKGSFDVGAALDNTMKLQNMQARYNQGPFSVGANYSPQGGVGANIGYRQSFQEGGLATSLRTPPFEHLEDVEFINTRNQHMREVAGKSAYADGGGAWTRKEGQNPEGGLNAKGRASLRAQGHDIKPPVSAKQAKKSPKAAARRSSFCARSAGQAKMFPEAARDPNSRLNKARRKWDC